MTAVLYILARNDLASMNSGKLAAQCSHASNAFVHHYRGYEQSLVMNAKQTETEANNVDGFREWETCTTQGFGTVLVLEGNMMDISSTVKLMTKIGYVAGVVHDPTYPVVDGDIVHYIPLDTCAYIFVPNKEADKTAQILLKKFPLHR
jgi:peptidyl-tRNA hydrolase